MRNWIVVFLAMTTIVFYQNCSGRHETLDSGSSLSSSTSIDDVDIAKSLVAFTKTVFPITQDPNNCVRCHGVDQQPLHSLPDAAISHDIMFSFGLIDLRDPPNSRIVLKIAGGHNGFPQQIATDLEVAIEAWADELIANGGLIDSDPNIVGPLYSSLFTNIFEVKCLTCHSPTGTNTVVDYTDYLSTLNTGMVIPGDAAGSRAYSYANGHGDTPLTPEEQAALAQWINLGALNN